MAHWNFAHWDSGVRYDAPEVTRHPAMRDLTRFLDNPFDDKGVSIGELFAFTSDHLGRMAANNPGGELAGRITATTAALQLVEDCYTDDETKLAIRKARKQAKDSARQAMRQDLARVAGAVIAQFGEGSPQFTECFPHGRSVFHTCRDDQLEAQLQVVVNGITAHQAELGAPLVAQITAIRTGWTTVYEASESSSSDKTATQEEKRLARENLQLMLFLNLLKLAEMFARQPEKLPLYMQQHLLENPDTGETPEEPEPEPEPPPPPEE